MSDSTKYLEIPEDGETKYELKFKDGKTVKVTKHDLLLSGFLTDYLKSGIAGDSDDAPSEPLPVSDFSSATFKLIHNITNLIKSKDPKLYLQYINSEKVRF